MPDFKWLNVQNTKDNFLTQFQFQEYHPEDPQYGVHWRGLKQKCVNGVWFKDGNKWRYGPGRLGFMGMFCMFEEWDGKVRVHGKPTIRDLEWHFGYLTLEGDGFSGFSEDDNVTCDRLVLTLKYEDLDITKRNHLALINKNGKFKEFVEPREYLYKLHDSPLGYPLYNNQAKNIIVAGSRGGGKSYYTALGECLFDICFNNLKYFDPSYKDDRFYRLFLDNGKKIKSYASIEVTDGGQGKAAELLQKAKEAMNFLATESFVGAFGDVGNKDYQPCPFWKRMGGSIRANNKGNPWKELIRVKIDGEWVEIEGSKVFHTVYSKNQQGGGAKSAGGRRTRVVHEEIGLNVLLLDAIASNEGMVKEGTEKKASQKCIGTSGEADTVESMKEIFTHPLDYDFLSFNYPERIGDFGFFLPAYMVDGRYKDKNGMTDIEKAKKEVLRVYEQEAKKSNPDIFVKHRMNFPFNIEDMWVTDKGNRLPSLEAELREQELMKDNLYEKIGVHIKLFWDHSKSEGINYYVDFDAKPFYKFPIPKDRLDWSGCITMYINPEKLRINGKIPRDAVVISHDPYISDDTMGSLGAAHVVVNPKYIPNGLPGNEIAATYIGRPRLVKTYNENLEKLCAFYGNPIHGLWYEANRGEKVRAHFLQRKRWDVLCLRPQFSQGSFRFVKSTTQTGYIVGNELSKVSLIDGLSDWLIESWEDEEGEETNVIQKIPCIFTIRQIKQFKYPDKGGNYDAISSLQAIPLAFKEKMFYTSENLNKKNSGFAKLNKKLNKIVSR